MLENDLRMEWGYKIVTLHYPTECDEEGHSWLKYCLEPEQLKPVKDFLNKEKSIVDIDWDGAMTDIVCFIKFKYNTSEKDIKQICEKALNLIKEIVNNIEKEE